MVEYSIYLAGDFAVAFVDDVFYLLLSPLCETEVLFGSDILDHFLLTVHTVFFFSISFSKRHFHGHTKITDKLLSFFQCSKFLFYLSSTLFLNMARDVAQFHRVLR